MGFYATQAELSSPKWTIASNLSQENNCRAYFSYWIIMTDKQRFISKDGHFSLFYWILTFKSKRNFISQRTLSLPPQSLVVNYMKIQFKNIKATRVWHRWFELYDHHQSERLLNAHVKVSLAKWKVGNICW